MKSAGPSLTRVRPERRGTTPNGTPIRLGAVTATNTTPPRGQKAKVHKGAGGGCRGLGGTPVLGSAATVHATAGTKAGTVLEHQPTFPRPCMKLHLCAVHGEMYLYTYMPNASLLQRKESSCITLEGYAYAVLTRASSHQFCMYQRCSQLRCLSKES